LDWRTVLMLSMWVPVTTMRTCMLPKPLAATAVPVRVRLPAGAVDGLVVGAVDAAAVVVAPPADAGGADAEPPGPGWLAGPPPATAASAGPGSTAGDGSRCYGET